MRTEGSIYMSLAESHNGDSKRKKKIAIDEQWKLSTYWTANVKNHRGPQALPYKMLSLKRWNVIAFALIFFEHFFTSFIGRNKIEMRIETTVMWQHQSQCLWACSATLCSSSDHEKKHIEFDHNHEMKLIGKYFHVSNVPQNVFKRVERRKEKKIDRMGVLNFSFLP